MRLSQQEYTAILARQRANKTPAHQSPGVAMESDLQDDIESECKRRGWLPLRSRMDRATTMPVGCPDFIILAEGGRLLLVEAKARNGKPTAEQAAMHAWAHKLGHEVFVVRNMDEFYAVMKLARRWEVGSEGR